MPASALPASELALRQIDPSRRPDLDRFIASLAASRESALLLDFDGTLAPFRIDPSTARPWSGVPALLDQIQQSGRTHLLIVTGRPAREVPPLLGLTKLPEIWGLHGNERLFPDGRLERHQLPVHQAEAIEAARHAVRAANLNVRIEDKWNAVALHWRGKSPRSAQLAQAQSLKLLRPFSQDTGVSLLQFEAGVELRAGRNKGDVVRFVLEQISDDTRVAYLGDDTTDEDAFRAILGRGLGVLVRREQRPTAAEAWLRPPQELRWFLYAWLRATAV
jgi:trehalose-phosphatase